MINLCFQWKLFSKLFLFAATCTTGICITKEGKDPTLVHNLPGDHTKDECLADCLKYRNKMGTQVTGCEHKHEIQCHVHLHPVDKGNGREDATCCVYGGRYMH